MQFLRALLWTLIGVLIGFFVFFNWNERANVRIGADLIADIRLPILMILCVLAGTLPTWGWHSLHRWRLRNRLATSERAVQDLRSITITPPVKTTEPVPGDPL